MGWLCSRTIPYDGTIIRRTYFKPLRRCYTRRYLSTWPWSAPRPALGRIRLCLVPAGKKPDTIQGCAAFRLIRIRCLQRYTLVFALFSFMFFSFAPHSPPLPSLPFPSALGHSLSLSHSSNNPSKYRWRILPYIQYSIRKRSRIYLTAGDHLSTWFEKTIVFPSNILWYFVSKKVTARVIIISARLCIRLLKSSILINLPIYK